MIEPQELDGGAVPVRSAVVLTAELDGEAVAYHPGTGAVVVLNRTAALVWSSLDGASTLDALAARLAHAFGADPDQVRMQVMELMRGFGANGLLEGVRPASGGER
jgi:hypothetical protein